jgi:hydroxymethylpyrimidine kinase / phosphomethylpyrimidine kinase / thiamine-phosphate diphosphorylase
MTGTPQKPIVWTIGGSDSCAGAGIQADLKTMQGLGVYGCSVVTAITAQNTLGVFAVEPVSPEMIHAQLNALSADLFPAALKIGMLGDVPALQCVSDFLEQLPKLATQYNKPMPYIVCDPVMVSTSGDSLLTGEAQQVLRQKIFPFADLITPNLPETIALTKMAINNQEELSKAANLLLSSGVRAVLVKGGHPFEGAKNPSPYCQDYWIDEKQSVWLHGQRHLTDSTHGSGCTLSAALVSAVASGYTPLDAAIIAKSYVSQGIRLAPVTGSGHQPLAHASWPDSPLDMPFLTDNTSHLATNPAFPSCGEQPLGFYPVVDRAAWLEKLLPMGVKTVQLRIKDLTGTSLAAEVSKAVEIAKPYQCRLFVNDYWELAIQYDAYGVHLGQSDLTTANLDALSRAGIRLGVSTHCYQEVARALAIQPSYIAVGPVFETTTKAMSFKPQGLEALKRWRKLLTGYPVVAIAGIFLENAPDVLACGVDGIAVVRDVTQATHLENRVAQWLSLWKNQPLQSGTTEKTFCVSLQ